MGMYTGENRTGGNFPPYYLLDLDGDGVMDVRRDGPDDIAVPQSGAVSLVVSSASG